MNKNTKIVLALVVVLVIVLGGVMLAKNKSDDEATDNMPNTTTVTKSTDTSSSSSSTSTNSVEKVSISDMAFNPEKISVKVGTTVTWTNNDSTAHTVSSDTESADVPNSGTLAKGDSYSFKFSKAGTYKYHCNFHSSMTGTVTVTE